ncbi:MAG: hypothetical protein AAFN93_28230 [Bacteroidota bacterium]
MDKAQKNILNLYWGLLKNLSNEWKLDLIEKLSQSVRENIDSTTDQMELAFGAWEDERSADQLIGELTSNRRFNREIEEF